MLDLRGFVILPTTIGIVIFWHEYCIVRELPIDVILVAMLLLHTSALCSTPKISKLNSNLIIVIALSVQLIELIPKAELKLS